MKTLEPITQKILAHMRGHVNSFTLACSQSSKTESVIRFALEKVKEEDGQAKLVVIVTDGRAIKEIQSNIIERDHVSVIRGFGFLEFRNKTNVSILRIVSVDDETLRGMRPHVVIYDEPAFFKNTLRVISYLNAPSSHYVTSYNPKNIAFFDFIKSYPTLVINWREVHAEDEAWIRHMAETLSSSDFFNEYENGRSQ